MVKNHSDSERGNPLPPHGYSFIYESSYRQDNTYHDLCYTSREALAGTRNSLWFIWCRMLSVRSTKELRLAANSRGTLAGPRNSSMKVRSDDPSHHERTLLPRSYQFAEIDHDGNNINSVLLSYYTHTSILNGGRLHIPQRDTFKPVFQ